MTKNEVGVVFNGCYGGAMLSQEGIILGRKLSGDDNWLNFTIKGEDGYLGYGGSLDYEVDRTDDVLVKVVETLLEKASGRVSSLKVEYVKKGSEYRIEEYDGWEEVVLKSDIHWSVA